MSSFSSRSSFISNMNRLICVLLGSYILLLVLNKSPTVDATEYSWNMAETRQISVVFTTNTTTFIYYYWVIPAGAETITGISDCSGNSHTETSLGGRMTKILFTFVSQNIFEKIMMIIQRQNTESRVYTHYVQLGRMSIEL